MGGTLVTVRRLLPVCALMPDTLSMPTPTLDQLDARIVRLFSDEPNVGVLGASRRLGVARGTVQARLDRLTARGVIRSFAPTVDPAALGYPVTAFCTLEIRQGRGHGPVVEHLAKIPEVLEAHTITGSGDLLIRAVARDNADLQRVIDLVVDDSHVIRASTAISLATRIDFRTAPLVLAASSS
jgi:DNA-binding Lrp family transcriptional regulator